MTEKTDRQQAGANTQESMQDVPPDLNLQWIQKKVPMFGINGSKIQVIQEPSEFFDILKQQARYARKRIVLASLYLGTGSLENELVSCIDDAIQKQDPANKLQVEVLLDYTRGSRDSVNSRTMLLPLIRQYNDQVNVSLYHSPDLRGVAKSILGERWNEIIGLNHLKVYLFDDNVILSGANLSDSYFTNRQDRYMLIKDSPEIANFFQDLVRTVSGLSFRLHHDDTVALPDSLRCHPYGDGDNGLAYRSEGSERLQPFLDPESNWKQGSPSQESVDTWIFPLLQMAPFGIRTDEKLTRSFLATADKDTTVYLGSGYFNLTEGFIDTIINYSKADFKILSASPEANGFFNGAGVSRYVPDAYTYISHSFMQQIENSQQGHRLSMLEYSRPGWTFHGKGLWHYRKQEALPYLTIIGSSNFGYRSMYRDLETQLVIATTNQQLRQQLHQEQTNLYQKSSPVSLSTFTSPARRVSFWVPYVTNIIRKFF